jgi:hypothetical protein
VRAVRAWRSCFPCSWSWQPVRLSAIATTDETACSRYLDPARSGLQRGSAHREASRRCSGSTRAVRPVCRRAVVLAALGSRHVPYATCCVPPAAERYRSLQRRTPAPARPSHSPCQTVPARLPHLAIKVAAVVEQIEHQCLAVILQRRLARRGDAVRHGEDALC